ncbi:DUF418 domain-containing protein [Kurthia sibirica]|uniref:DUF418 domain-containing protein n=1 Tax=Kurthia sibirica TaxID=202750 RepID=A0A2U3AMQ3_9BACL|nr:DUF418 domain-containing protein [Kurthia sibirica]PWI25830.1 hypothetical protein DEX24_06405 [Kurthia sibirica]GEK33649.1 hypothetical protein KSI01_11820 [Kurthia sibirica]
MTPRTLKNRVETLDFIRGSSLFGILLVNILVFNYPIPYVDLKTILTVPLDLQYEKGLSIFVQGSFYPIFAMLFGYGLAMQYDNAQQIGKPFYKKAVKRMFILLIIGVLHAVFIWYGDILMMYAVFGFLVLAVLKYKPSIVLLIGSTLFLMFTVPNFLSFVIAEQNPTAYVTEEFSDLAAMKSRVEAATAGSWYDVFVQNWTDVKLQNSPVMWMQGFFSIFPYMLFGVAASKWKLIERCRDFIILWFILLLVFLPLGLWLKTQAYTDQWVYLGDYFAFYLGGLVLAVGYVAVLVILTMLPGVLRIVKPISNVGRMSLTTYLMQSIIQGIIFYHYGFGLYAEYGLDGLLMIAIMIYVAQIAFAAIWLNFFKQGPVEMVWKKITYGKLIMPKQDSH